MTRSTKSTAHACPSAGSVRMIVAPGETGWVMKRSEDSRLDEPFPTKAAATRAAQAVMRGSGGELRVHGRDGRIQQTLTLGRHATTKVAEVEGIRFTGELARTFQEFDRKGLSSDERRQAVARRFSARKPA